MHSEDRAKPSKIKARQWHKSTDLWELLVPLYTIRTEHNTVVYCRDRSYSSRQTDRQTERLKWHTALIHTGWFGRHSTTSKTRQYEGWRHSCWLILHCSIDKLWHAVTWLRHVGRCGRPPDTDTWMCHTATTHVSCSNFSTLTSSLIFRVFAQNI